MDINLSWFSPSANQCHAPIGRHRLALNMLDPNLRMVKGTSHESCLAGMEPFEGPSPSAPSASSSPIYEIPAVNSQALVDFWRWGSPLTGFQVAGE